MCEKNEKGLHTKIFCDCMDGSTDTGFFLFFICKTGQCFRRGRYSWQGHNAGYFIPSLWTGKTCLEKADNVTDYYIYYKEKKSGKWTKLASVKAGTTSYVHKSSAKYPLTTGRSYAYTVKAYNSASQNTVHMIKEES